MGIAGMGAKRGRGLLVGVLSFLFLLFLIVIVIVLTIVLVALLGGLQNALLAPEGWLFSAAPSYIAFVLTCAVELPLLLGLFLLLGILMPGNSIASSWLNSGLVKLILVSKIGRALLFVAWVICLYLSVFCVTYADGEQVIYHDAFHPQGITYQYSDVKEVKAGFGNKNMDPNSSKNAGEFFYLATFGDRTIDFSYQTANEKIDRYDDTYLELEEFDEALMQYNPQKQSMQGSYRDCNMDSVYVERFLRIIERR